MTTPPPLDMRDATPGSGVLSAHLRRIRDIQPQLLLDQVAVIEEGLVNVLIVVNDSVVFRFPRTDWGRERLAIEHRVLQMLHGRLTVALPVPLHCDEDVLVYRKIPGRALHQHDLIAHGDQALRLGSALAVIHDLPLQAINHAGIPETYTTRTPEQWLAFYEDVRLEVFPFLTASAQAWVEEHFAPLLSNALSLAYTPALIHGNLRPNHIIFEPGAQRISGIIDFGSAGIGDPAEDVAGILHGFGESAFQRLRATYPCSQDTLQRARFIAGTFELRWLLNGIRSRHTIWYARHIGHARDIRPVMDEQGH